MVYLRVHRKFPFDAAIGQTLGAVAVLHGIALLEYTRLYPRLDTREMLEWTAQFHVLLSLSFVLSVYLCLVPTRKTNPAWLAFHVFVVCLMNYPETGSISLAIILFSVPVLEAALLPLHALWSVVLIPATALVSARVHPVPFWNRPRPELTLQELAVLAGALGLVTFAAFWMRRMTERARIQFLTVGRLNSSIEKLLAANLDFQNYAAEIGEKSTIQERKRLTREVHDIVGYTLINLRMMMEAAVELAPPSEERLRELLERAREQSMSGLLETRKALRNFRAIDSAVLGTANRIQRLVRSFSQATGIAVDINYGNTPTAFSPELDKAVVRMIQESMTNAFRHGKATEIHIDLWADAGRLSVRIIDNGGGAAEVKPGIGISGMTERIEALGGSFSARSSEYGFVVLAHIPLSRRVAYA